MRFESDDLRPKGSVEVRCSTPGCGNVWWVDPLDPRLPEGPFDCGDDHQTTAFVQRRLSMLRLRHGVMVATMRPSGPPRGDIQGNPGASASLKSALATVWDRERGVPGTLEWQNVGELGNPDSAFAQIDWSRDRWVATMKEMGVDPDEEVSPGLVRWVGYKANGAVRKYTFAKCAREGCPHRVMVDVKDPTFQPDTYMIGSWGGGTMPAPEWWGQRTFKCEEGLSTSAPNPCVLVRSDAIAQYEQASGSRWTMWHSPSDDSGTVLFWTPRTKRFSLLTYEDLSVFTTASRISQDLHHGSLVELEALLRRRRGNMWDDVLGELQIHTELPS